MPGVLTVVVDLVVLVQGRVGVALGHGLPVGGRVRGVVGGMVGVVGVAGVGVRVWVFGGLVGGVIVSRVK